MEDTKYERLLGLILKIKDDVSELKVSQASNSAVLEEHIRRTELAEKNLEFIETRIQTIEERDQKLTGFWKISLGVLGVVGSISAILSAIHSLR